MVQGMQKLYCQPVSISGTEILDDTVTLTTDTNGNYVATITAGNGLTGDVSSEGSTPTLAVGAGTGILSNANDVAVDQAFSPTWTGAHTFTPSSTNDFTVNVDADSNIQVTATGSVPAVDMIAISNSAQVVTADTIDALSIDFRTGNGTNPVNSGINLSLVNGGADVGDTLNGLNISSFTTSSGSTSNGVNIAAVTSNGTDTGIKVGAGWDTGLAISQNNNGKGLTVTATGVPTADQVQITNAGQAVATANVNGLSINYTGGAAAVESAGERIDLTPGTTAAGTWSGLRVVANATGPVAQVIENGIKLEGPTSITAGGIANAIEIKNPKFTTALNVEEASNGPVLNSPFGGVGRYENFVTRSEEFDHADWAIETVGVTLTANNTTAPDGTTTAEKLADNATAGTRISQTITSGNSVTWTFSVWIKNNDATTSFKIGLFDNTLAGASDVNTITVSAPSTDNWQRYSVTHTTAGSGVTNVVPAIDVNQGNSTRSIYIWGAQLEKQSSPGVYVKTMGSALAFSGSNGLVVDGNLKNNAASDFIYGSRFIERVTSTNAGTHDGVFMRIQDDSSSVAHTVRGLEVQAWNGSNTSGTNIGIDAYGKTFGIAGTTDALAGGVASPAAVFAYLQNTSATSTGNAVRAYSDKATGATMVSIYTESSHFTGNGLVIDLGNVGSGSGDFASGNFISLKNSGTQKFHIDSGGNMFATLANSGTEAVCHAGSEGVTDDQITDCSGAPVQDYAEMYPVASGITYGDVVSIGTKDVAIKDGIPIKQLVKSAKPYDEQVIGIVSNNYNDFTSTGYHVIDPSENPMPVALNGRVPVNLSLENGSVQPGDFVTTSTIPGFAMKANQPGWVIGEVLSGLNDQGQVMVYVRSMYYDPTTHVDSTGNVILQRSNSSIFEANTSQAVILINQKGSGDLLQIQSDGTDKLLVKNNGELNINVTSFSDSDSLFVVKSNDSEVFNINARGQVSTTGNIIVRDDTFAGSIATGAEGGAQITFTYDLGTGKPDVQLTVEGETPAFAQVAAWKKDANNNYTGVTIKTFAPAGGPASVIVHYLVVGKEPDYQTSGKVMQVVTANQGSQGSGDQTSVEQQPDNQAAGSQGSGEIPVTTTDTTTPTESQSQDQTTVSQDITQAPTP
jgi:hypothetical protein